MVTETSRESDGGFAYDVKVVMVLIVASIFVMIGACVFLLHRLVPHYH